MYLWKDANYLKLGVQWRCEYFQSSFLPRTVFNFPHLEYQSKLVVVCHPCAYMILNCKKGQHSHYIETPLSVSARGLGLVSRELDRNVHMEYPCFHLASSLVNDSQPTDYGMHFEEDGALHQREPHLGFAVCC